MRAAILDADHALDALVRAQQVTWSSGAAALYRSALADAARLVRLARAQSESAAVLAAGVDRS